MYRSMRQGKLLATCRPCRFVANRRYPVIASHPRHFSSSRIQLLAADDPRDVPSSTAREAASTDGIPPLGSAGSSGTQNENTWEGISPAEQILEKKDQSPYGSAVRRAMRNVKPRAERPPPSVYSLPEWFYEKNFFAFEPNKKDDDAQIEDQLGILRLGSEEKPENDRLAEGGEGGQSGSNDFRPRPRYTLTDTLWEELYASVKAGLRLPHAKYANEPSATRSHLVLQYPGNDGIVFLGAVVKRLAREVGANLLTLNAQDIAQLCTEYDLSDRGMTSSIRSLGYEVHRPPSSKVLEEPEEEEEDVEEDDDESTMPKGISTPKFIAFRPFKGGGDDIISSRLKSIVGSLEDRLDGTRIRAGGSGSKRPEGSWFRLVSELVSLPNKLLPRPSAVESSLSTELHTGQFQGCHLIIQVEDYRDIQNTSEGSKFLALLQQVVQDRRLGGSRIMLVGTTAQAVKPSTLPDIFRVPGDVGDDAFAKTLVVTPAMTSSMASEIFAEDRKKRTKYINIRHLQEMLRIRLSGFAVVIDDIFDSYDWPLDPSIVKESGLSERYWPYNQIHWAATLALGCLEPNEAFGLKHIQRGIALMQKADRIKNSWLQEKPAKSKHREVNNRERLLSTLRRTCNRYEKKLLNGVVDAKSIRITFSDVHATSDNIEALKTLTTLSLIRPEAFTYGVLATDKIPGLLLYGPPGTGKTLLAKAVARESGATVLEVSGSDVYDMYVGEGEKNVRAIFTLAKKLSPCVVFIDEADAIFCSRTGGSHRSSHRELINQFLREWDGMSDLSAFIMVATNRPFDLDDAVLRRLPRRLLVDLPTEQDRLEILKIHLKEEVLDPSVDLAELARKTPLYSGSDLKNLSVAAALACVREENDRATKCQSEEPYEHPERRVLTQAHFERGMEEISASISEDMSSLAAIKKFDEQFGDRKGRRQKNPNWGFGLSNQEETREESVRVRG